MTAGSLIYAILAALVIGVGLQPLVVRVMTTASVLDIPSDRSSHTIPTPRGGGVAVALAVGVALLLLPLARPLALPVLLFAVIGLVEDVRGVPILPRFASQLLVGAGTGLVLMPLDAPTAIQVAIVVVTAVWLTAFVNAFNFMDGINGISAMYATLAGTVYALAGLRRDLPILTGAGAVIAVAALTFLPWNAGRARIFLGDVGSYGLGGGLGALAMYAVLHGVPVEVALAPLAVYLADTGWTLLRRMARGEAWYRPHRTHVYQRLTDVSWSHQRVTLAIAMAGTAVNLCALAAVENRLIIRAALDVLALALLAVYLASPDWLAIRMARREQARIEQARLNQEGANIYA
jgi:UDP-N-acetylmuramyl pentapeptide phosphotransferase/UDP-N-acetylglucosamine-1-phosphate transferase